jgi:hypothetical protein
VLVFDFTQNLYTIHAVEGVRVFCGFQPINRDSWVLEKVIAMDIVGVEAIGKVGDTLADEISARISFLTFLTAQVYHPLPRLGAICFGFHPPRLGDKEGSPCFHRSDLPGLFKRITAWT